MKRKVYNEVIYDEQTPLLNVPELVDNKTSNTVCFKSKAKDMEPINLPTERVPDWQNKAVELFGEMLDKYKGLRLFMDSCVRCGSCSDKCHYFLGTGDPKNMPVSRQELMRSVYRKYFTMQGKIFKNSKDCVAFDDNILKDWFTYFYQCSECRRCCVFCPQGIDTAEVTMAAREIMARLGVGTKYVTEVVHKVYTTGNNLGIWAPAWIDNCKFLEEELIEETGLKIPLPVDVNGAEVLLVPPSADNFVNTNTMLGYAKMFYAAGVSWTTSTFCNEGGNFGMFLNYHNYKTINNRILKAARDLNVKYILWGECGHAWRAGYMTRTLSGSMDFLTVKYPKHVCQFTNEMIKKGAFKLDKTANDHLKVTYHDPCNVARATTGMLEPPRDIIRATCNNFKEMHPDTTREKTFCCGGGGGMLADELMSMRMAGSKPRCMAVKATGANYLATPCAICKANFGESLKFWDTGAVVGGVHDLLSNALILNH
ncbi:MAG: dsrK [Ignavibacteria bacterium]|nr:dsrK [Ignavibacteria bacterium]